MRIEQGIAAPCLNSIFKNLYAYGCTQYLHEPLCPSLFLFLEALELTIVLH